MAEEKGATMRSKFFRRLSKTGISKPRRASIGGAKPDAEEVGCLICLDVMKPTDLAHPLMCKSKHCCFNFCCNCIESLMQQEHEGMSAVTDGSEEDRSRILLHCPNCRSDLGPTICDTVLLRKIDELHTELQSQENVDESLLDLKKAMETDVSVLREIADARDREARFWDQKCGAGEKEEREVEDEARNEQEHDEWGFEVDIRLGAHETMKLPRELTTTNRHSRAVDKTLLSGLESAMSVHEQKQVTRLMTSGDTSDLARAAELLSSIAATVHGQGSIYSGRNEIPSRRDAAVLKPRDSHRQTVYQLIEDGKRARRRQNESPHLALSSSMSPAKRKNQPRYVKSSTIKAAKHRQIEQQLRAKLAYMRLHPLPVRMPKYAEFTIDLNNDNGDLEPNQIVKSLPFRFCNDTWDGTVIDAFSKIDVNPKPRPPKGGKNYNPVVPKSVFVDNYIVTHHTRDENAGVRNILDGGDSSNAIDDATIIDRGDVRIDTEHPRVVIASVVHLEAGLKGILKGDVVTHLNGVELRDATVDELIALIWSLCCSSSEGASTTLRFGFNADRATAEALKMRDLVSNKSFW